MQQQQAQLVGNGGPHAIEVQFPADGACASSPGPRGEEALTPLHIKMALSSDNSAPLAAERAPEPAMPSWRVAETRCWDFCFWWPLPEVFAAIPLSLNRRLSHRGSEEPKPEVSHCQARASDCISALVDEFGLQDREVHDTSVRHDWHSHASQQIISATPVGHPLRTEEAKRRCSPGKHQT